MKRMNMIRMGVILALLCAGGCSDDSGGPDCSDPTRCDDENACTEDSCDPVTGCHHTTLSCDDQDACTADSCNETTGCINEVISCDDDDLCTTDSCDTATGCTHDPVICDDDGDPCTQTDCDPATGCGNSPVTCDDGDPCTTETCTAGVGCQVTELLCADLRADVNRDGTVDLTDPTDDADEDTWDASHGAVFLANIDDDELACPTTGTDASLAACNDAADNVVNGTADLEDLAILRVAPWPNAPADASAIITVSTAAMGFVRLFVLDGGSYTEYQSGDPLEASQLQAGVELRIEALDFVRDDTVWDGSVDLTLDVHGGTAAEGALPSASDTVQLRVAPVVFSHPLNPVGTSYVTAMSATGNVAFRNDFSAAATGAQVAHQVELDLTDQWTGDVFQTASMSMPATGGRHTIEVAFRSANYTSSTLRTAGRVVFTDLRGVDRAGAVHYDPAHPDSMDTLNSFSNLLVIPPHGAWPLGRVVRGGRVDFYPDEQFDAMIRAQGGDSTNTIGLQDVVTVDTSWLLTAHIAEIINFVPATTTLGWVMLMADPAQAISLLQQAQNDGHGAADLFVGKTWLGGASAVMDINEILGDASILTWNQAATIELDSVRTALMNELGITASDIVSVPAIFWQQSGLLTNLLPSLVNGVVLAGDAYGAPDPHGPQINGVDLFGQQLETTLGGLGITTYWIEDWDLYHRSHGGVGTGSNEFRQLPATTYWWSSGL